MAAEIPDYPALQDRWVAACAAVAARSVLDLGVGSGLGAERLLVAQPTAHLTGVDGSAAMLAAARDRLDPARTTLLAARLEDPLPTGAFDLVTSMLAVHHLDGPGKADLFTRVAGRLAPWGRFVLADLVVPEDPSEVVTPVDGVVDVPSPLDDQCRWLADAGLEARTWWRHRDLAVVVAAVPTG